MKKNLLNIFSALVLFVLVSPQLRVGFPDLRATGQDVLHADDCPSWATGCGGNPKPKPEPKPEPDPKPEPQPKPEPPPDNGHNR